MKPSTTDYVRMELMQGSSVLYTRNIMANETFSFNYTPTSTGNYSWRFRRLVSSSSASSTYFKLDNMSVSYIAQATSTVCNGSSKYRFGFGGHEKDNEVSGEGNHLSFNDYGLDTRLGRRWNIDPKASKYPSQSPYSVFNGNPIYYEDPTGESGEASINKQAKTYFT